MTANTPRRRGAPRRRSSPITPRLAAIDVGTNSVLLVVAEIDGTTHKLRPLLERAEITRLGRGVDRTGVLSAEGIDATVGVLTAYVRSALALGVSSPADIACVATSAARDARNGPVFLAKVEQACALRPMIVDGEREAGLSFLAATREFGGENHDLLVEDIGGGSTELVLGVAEHPSLIRSLPVGSVRLFERWVRTDPPTRRERQSVEDDIAGAIREVTVRAGVGFVGLAGTWTTLAAIACGSTTYDAAMVHGKIMTRDEVSTLTEQLWRSPLEERRSLPGLQPGRADVIPIGASIARMSMEMLSIDRVTVSDRGVRWGLLYERLAGHS